MSDTAADRFIPWYFVLFFCVLTVIFAGFTYIAHVTHPGVVTEEAYEKGLHYNKLIARADAQAQLGWSSVIAISYPVPGKARLSLTLKDKEGMPVSQAAVAATMVRPARQSLDFRVELVEQSPGVYAADLNPPVPGLWEVQVGAEKGADSYQDVKRVELKHE